MSRKVDVDNLLIEVTRRCNMECQHCLRGDVLNQDIDIGYVDTLFSQIGRIHELAFTGGEPGLNVSAIREILERAKFHDVEVGSFYIATNGTVDTDEFVRVLIDWYLYCDDNECTCVAVSVDRFHEGRKKPVHALKLNALKFMSTRGEDSKPEHMLAEGRGYYNLSGVTNRTPSESSFMAEVNGDTMQISEGELYLNCNGDLVNGCDWSYDNQYDHIIGHVDELKLWDWGISIVED